MIEAFQLHGEMPTFPVIVVHLEDPMGSGLAACSGIPFRTTDQHKGVPRFLCPGCARPGRECELQAGFDLRWAADMRAIKRWQAAHPGKDLVWPDHADLVVWLLEQLEP